MSLTPEQRRTLKKRCTIVVPGFAVTTPAEEFAQMAAWCAHHAVDHDLYGEGGIVEAFEKKIATLLGKPAAVLMPSGVMAQLVAVRLHAEAAKLDRFGLHPTSHLALHEEQSYAALMHLHGVTIGDRLRPMTAADLEVVAQPLACAIVELPIREAGGRLPTWHELESLKGAASARGLALHMDGARLWESAAHYGRTYAEIAHGFASVYVSLYKGIGAFAGAVLAADAAFVAQARLWRRRMGGTLHQLSPFVVSAAMRFDQRIASMPALHDRALRFASMFSALPTLRVAPAVPQTNMLHLYVAAGADAVMDARDAMAEATGAWLVDRVRPAEVPGWSATEIYVGDRLLALDDASLMPLFARLVDDASVASSRSS